MMLKAITSIIRIFGIERIIGPKLTMGGYDSRCLERSHGEIIILVNDDMVIRRKGWDEKIRW